MNGINREAKISCNKGKKYIKILLMKVFTPDDVFFIFRFHKSRGYIPLVVLGRNLTSVPEVLAKTASWIVASYNNVSDSKFYYY